MGRKTKEYALYRGDEFLAMGDLKQIHELTGIAERTLYHHKANGDRFPYDQRYILVEVVVDD